MSDSEPGLSHVYQLRRHCSVDRTKNKREIRPLDTAKEDIQ